MPFSLSITLFPSLAGEGGSGKGEAPLSVPGEGEGGQAGSPFGSFLQEMVVEPGTGREPAVEGAPLPPAGNFLPPVLLAGDETEAGSLPVVESGAMPGESVGEEATAKSDRPMEVAVHMLPAGAGAAGEPLPELPVPVSPPVAVTVAEAGMPGRGEAQSVEGQRAGPVVPAASGGRPGSFPSAGRPGAAPRDPGEGVTDPLPASREAVLFRARPAPVPEGGDEIAHRAPVRGEREPGVQPRQAGVGFPKMAASNPAGAPKVAEPVGEAVSGALFQGEGRQPARLLAEGELASPGIAGATASSSSPQESPSLPDGEEGARRPVGENSGRAVHPPAGSPVERPAPRDGAPGIPGVSFRGLPQPAMAEAPEDGQVQVTALPEEKRGVPPRVQPAPFPPPGEEADARQTFPPPAAGPERRVVQVDEGTVAHRVAAPDPEMAPDRIQELEVYSRDSGLRLHSDVPRGGSQPQPAPSAAAGETPAGPRIESPPGHRAWEESMARHALKMAGEGVSRATLHLNPASLGTLEVQVTTEGDEARIQFHSQHTLVRDAVEAALPRLREMFHGSGLNLVEVEVSRHGSFATGGQAGSGQANTGSGEQGSPRASGHVEGEPAEEMRVVAGAAPASGTGRLDCYV